jgi:hypothetical protein
MSVLRAEPIATAMQAQRDSALRAMVTNDADRERLNSNLAKADVGVPAGGGRRGRSGGELPRAIQMLWVADVVEACRGAVAWVGPHLSAVLSSAWRRSRINIDGCSTESL